MTPEVVCYFTDSEVVGGAEIALLQGIRSLDRDAWRPVLLHHAGADLAPLLEPLADDGVRLVEVPRVPDRGGAPGVPRFVRALRAVRPAIFHAHQRCPGVCKFPIVGAIAANVPGIVATVHAFPDVELTRLASLEWSLIASRVDRFLVASRHGRAALARAIPGTEGRTDVVPNGIDVATYRRAPDPALRARLAPDRTRYLILVCARLDPDKGHATLLRACRGMADIQLVLAGEGPEAASLERLAAELGMADRVTVLGFRADVPELMAVCDMLVLPTRNEAFGLVLLEAMAAGLPVISTRVGGPEEIIRDGESGLLVPPADAPALAGAIRTIREDRALAARLAGAGRRQVEADFSSAATTAATTSVYTHVLAGHVTAP